ncbi:LuxR family maltose regulon positive regulatory protein [Kribbella amoyensis]|uniref:LuxR family maltose regulon positive regulatory protein n=1 Tax=Kribbella amoyensis TaxID=996641 RepID=A0A561BUC7_9ACTN|nr:LuxR C-terminal-related transcriptional regulator [Kribbella amoyensis]TWD82486.1 LuxR family maltose regulon positive regulatory protein [Kribbella amoyensis]
MTVQRATGRSDGEPGPHVLRPFDELRPKVRRRRTGRPGSRIRPPAQSFRVVERQRLLDRVSQAVERHPFTLVSAPAGSGKTVLTSTWSKRQAESSPVAWLSLADTDDDAGRFWADLRYALADVSVDAGRTPYAVRAGAGDVDVLSEQLLRLDEPVVLVLDAAEHVRGAAVFDQLDRLIDTAGERLRVLMTTRADPPMPLHRYRLEGTLAEIRHDELAFTGPEVEAMLDPGKKVPEATTRQVLDRTEGWAAGVRLAALALRSGEHRAPLDGLADDYLLAEVFDGLSGPDRDFLLKVSLAEELTADLGTALTGRTDAGELLRRMAAGNTFVQPIRGRPQWYRIHPLFRDLLRAEAARTMPAAIDALHGRAADWLAGQGELVPAVRRACEQEDWVRAAGFVVSARGVGELLLAPPTSSVLGGCLAAMPDLDSADVRLVRAALAVGRDDLVSARTSLASCAAPDEAGDDWSLSAAVVTTRLSDMAGRTDDTLAAARIAREHLSRHPVARDRRLQQLNALVLNAEGTAYLRSGDLDGACAVLGDAVRSAAAVDCAELRLRSVATLALAEVCRGRLSRGQGLADTAERLASECVAERRPAATHLAHAWVALERQDLSRAQRSLDRARRLHETRDDALLSSVSALLRARLMRDRGDRVGARCVLRSPVASTQWLQSFVDIEAAGVGLPRAVGDAYPAVSVSQQVQELLENAQTQWGDGDTRGGRADVAKALSLARGERIRRPFAHTSARIRAMIRTDHALRSLAGWLRPEQTAGVLRPGDDPAPIIEDLSERELEVLRHLAALLTTEEIAAELFISVNTVKTHVRKILRKLSVANRNEAVRRAWDLHLV